MSRHKADWKYLRAGRFFIVCLFVAACSDIGPPSDGNVFDGADSNKFELIAVGAKKEQVNVILDDPDEVRQFIKEDSHIWGPEEAFWYDIKAGTELEMWRYNNAYGSLALYFVNGESVVSYKAFAPRGVVYEAN